MGSHDDSVSVSGVCHEQYKGDIAAQTCRLSEPNMFWVDAFMTIISDEGQEQKIIYNFSGHLHPRSFVLLLVRLYMYIFLEAWGAKLL